MSEEFKKMILSKWKGKITYPFNYKDFEELTELIELFENQNKDLQRRIDKAIWLLDLFISDTDLSRYDFLKILMDVKKKLKGKEMG